MALIPSASKKIQVAPSTGTPNWQILNGNGNIDTTVLCSPCPSGVVLIYIENQSIGKNVWFDDLFVGHYASDVLEENHYYPFELTLSKDAGGLTSGQPYKLTMKELEPRFDLNTYDFGARQYDMTIGRWTSVDPLAEKTGSWSPFNYVKDNPVQYFDPDGKNAVRVIDKENKTITIKAVYYVQTESQKGERTTGYSKNDIKSWNKIDEKLNDKNYTVSKGEYAGFKVKFDLEFKDGGTLENATELAKKEEVDGINTGNTVTKGDKTKISRFREKTDDSGQPTSRGGGFTINWKDITMNKDVDQYIPRVHEIFHIFFFNRDDADDGIGAYYKMGSVNQDDIDILINNNPNLKIIKPNENK